MIRRSRQLRLSATAGVAGNDTDALQTDVMRFMSIIGLCLMAVFALVQGLPVQDQGKAAAVAQSSRLREVVRTQQLQLEQLQDKLRALQVIASQADQRAVDVQAQSDSLDSALQQLRAQRQRLGAELAQVEDALVQARQSLATAQARSHLQAEQLAELKDRLQRTGQQLDKGRDEIARLQRATKRSQLDRQQKKRPAPVTKPAVIPDTQPAPRVVTASKQPMSRPVKKPGFSLQFASNTALDRLIASGEVSLYAMTERQTWRASLRGSEAVVVPAEKPRWFHEMATRTVPLHYRGGFDAARGGSNANVTWGVQLPEETRDAIRTLMQGRQGGELVILANGTVSVEE
jgi:small-conductance mechanosensitive channel